MSKPKSKPIILVVEDEEDMRLGVKHNLEYEGYDVIAAARGREGLQAVLSGRADLVILDIMLPEMNGFDILRAMRAQGVRTPVILLTSKGQETDKLEGFAAGADDYVTKPFSIQELAARVRAVLQRTQAAVSELDVFRRGDLEVDFTRHLVTRGGQPVVMALKEFEILQLLVRHCGNIVTREQMLREIWGYSLDNLPETRTVDNHIAKLRHKIGMECIETVPKVGYRLLV